MIRTMSTHPSQAGPGRQRGAVAILVAFSLVVLVLMLGLVLDLGHLFVTKSELQNAADACALGAARELNDLGSGALDRATSAGITVGSRNRADLQSDNVNIQPEDVTFGDSASGPFSRTISASTSYVRCAPHETAPKSVALWFMQLSGQTDRNLKAESIAHLGGGQTQCVIPLAMCTSAANGTANFGFTVGTWYSGRLASGTASHGNYDWVAFSGHGSGTLGEQIAGTGVCDVGSGVVDAKSGVSSGIAQAWNTRFGLYAGTYKDIDLYPPDRTGYAYTPNRVDSKGNLLPGSWPAAAPQNAYANYLPRKNVTHDPYNPTAFVDKSGKPQGLPGNPSPLSSTLHATKGQDRRLVFVPVIRCSDWAPNKKNMQVLGYACALLISPVNDADTDVQVEFRGAGQNTDCSSNGVPGESGTAVPKLVK